MTALLLAAARKRAAVVLVRQPYVRPFHAATTLALPTTTTRTSTNNHNGKATTTNTTTKTTGHAPTTPPPVVQGKEWLTAVDSTNQNSPFYYKNWIGNAFVESCSITTTNGNNSSNGRMPVINPATNQVHGYVVDTPMSQLDEAIQAAHDVFEQEWKHVPPQQRQRLFYDYTRLIQQHSAEIADLITAENGKTLADARGDVFRGLEVVETACQVTSHLLGDTLAGISRNMECISYREPLGVCAGICPFNFPAMIPLWMFPLAIASGNTFILKPSEKTPSAALMLAQLAAEAGIPPHVLQVVHGGPDTVQRLCHDERIKALSFVGSNHAGEYIANTGMMHGKRVQANLSAKNHAVVLPDVTDVSAVVRAVAGAAFGAAGQRCMALSVVILVGAAEQLIPDLIKAAQHLTVGAGWQDGVDLGPLINADAKKRVISIIDQAVEHEGARVLLDGRGCVVPGCEDGHFVGPTIVQCASTNHNILAYHAEIFGPVLTVLTVPTLQDAIHIIQANPYGNGCALFTSSGSAAHSFIRHVPVTQIGINTPIPVPLPMFSFTGGKNSMRGDLNFYGKSGVHFYTQLKTVTSHWPEAMSSLSSSSRLSPTSSSSSLGGVNMPVHK